MFHQSLHLPRSVSSTLSADAAPEPKSLGATDSSRPEIDYDQGDEYHPPRSGSKSLHRSCPHAAALAPKGRSSFISRLMRCTVPLPTPHSAATFKMPLPIRNWLWISHTNTAADRPLASFMPRKPKRYWRIEIEERHEVVFRRRLPGNLTENEIAAILQRLACRDLSVSEIISCSRRGKWKTSLLRVSFDSPPKARRPIVYLTNFPGYVASLWPSEEIPDEPEIDLLPPRGWE